MSGKDYIIPSLGGRLGNQMFMIAHAYAQSLKQNRELKISRHDLRYEGHEYDTNIFRKFQFIPNFESRDKSSIVYGGYFQSEKYFLHSDIDEIVKNLTFYKLNFSGKNFLISGANGFLGKYFWTINSNKTFAPRLLRGSGFGSLSKKMLKYLRFLLQNFLLKRCVLVHHLAK